ncbi:DUF1254 domain-containing protein [Bradyrhizobium sp. RDI18]|uniref:DUF1254 domain-containing protein n=1 Tax=Bradyrhizobium sp. RDI18 TaxID=3367400 RepID=UPI0037155AF2
MLALASVVSAPASAQNVSEQEAYEIARDAYQYAYPIVTMDVTRRQSTNVPNAATIPMRAPVNQFAHARSYPAADARDVVRFNFDTLYSLAWLDLSNEPIVLSVPDTGGRYYLLPMLDMWTDVFAVVGSRTTGTKAGHYAIVPLGWNSALPAGIDKIAAPTPVIWILGRTQTDGATDYANVHKIQDGYKLTPLSQWGKSYTPPASAATDASIDNKTPPLFQVNNMDGVTVLTRLAELLQKHPPHGNDYPILFRLRRLGIEAGKPFDASKLDPTTINTAAKAAREEVEQMIMKGFGIKANGWFYPLDGIGTYGTAYRTRAQLTIGGLGANLSEDAVYPTTFVDEDNRPLTGANRYILHFDKGRLPPADAFWSLTLYDKDGFQVPNPFNRFAVGDHFADNKLKSNADGSLDIYVQNESPGADKESNWLPSPKGEFNLSIRMYSPKREVLNQEWAPPPVRRLQ